MAENYIAPDEQYQIICPYCFNVSEDGEIGKPFPHTAVEFRAETFYKNQAAIEHELHMNRTDIDMMTNKKEREKATEKYDAAERFILKVDEKYQDFWDNYGGQTTEQDDNVSRGNHPWELPIIGVGKGVAQMVADKDGFVTHAIDVFGNETYRRVCPHCHNPLPLGFGKYPVKCISIIGVTGAGKTVYISQLLKSMEDYAAKVGLGAFFTTKHERDFVETNKVAKGIPLPGSTPPIRLSQPMFYEIVQNNGQTTRQDTIVLYDIAGENCRDAQSMVRFAKFVKHSDGIVLLIDPKQLNFVVNYDGDVDTDAPALALNTLHNILETESNKKSDIPIAVSISKSDQCFGILPQIAQDQVQYAGEDATGMPTKEFDGRSYNQLEQGLTELMKNNAMPVCRILQDGYTDYNFFSVSAIGCKCDDDNAPINTPDAKRIEEPILWLFKQFGFIKSNAKVMRPFKAKHADRYLYKKPLIGKAYLIKQEDEYSAYEEDKVRMISQVMRKGVWTGFSDEYADLIIK